MLAAVNQRFSIGLRLAIVGGIFTLFAVGVGVFNVMKGMESIASAQKELRGATYVDKVWGFVLSAKPDQTADAAKMNGHDAF